MKGKNPLRISLILLFSASALILVQTRCRHDDLNAALLDKVCYNDVAAILSSCSATAGCHNAGGSENKYTFTDYTSIMKSITPFNAQKSTAYKAITGKGFVQLMPPSGALPEKDRILIRVWIDQGAKSDTTACTHY